MNIGNGAVIRSSLNRSIAWISSIVQPSGPRGGKPISCRV
jgi:hypothetical protein